MADIKINKKDYDAIINSMNIELSIAKEIISDLVEMAYTFDLDDNDYASCKKAEAFLQKGAEFGYNKANEWHYVKDGDLPKENIYLVIRLNDENTCYKCCTGFWEKEERCFHTLFCNKVDIKDIIAWKEIVLPEVNK